MNLDSRQRKEAQKILNAYEEDLKNLEKTANKLHGQIHEALKDRDYSKAQKLREKLRDALAKRDKIDRKMLDRLKDVLSRTQYCLIEKIVEYPRVRGRNDACPTCHNPQKRYEDITCRSDTRTAPGAGLNLRLSF